MKKRLAAIVTIMALLLVPGMIRAAISGSVLKSSGEVTLTRSGKTISVIAGTPVFTDDVIQTKDNSECVMGFLDGSKIAIAENSDFSVKESVIKKDIRKIGLKLDKGEVRSLVEKVITEGSQFYVETPQTVAGVRGTDFITRTNPSENRTEVLVITGRVSVMDIASRREQMVTPGQMIRLGQNIRAPEVKKFDSQQMKPMPQMQQKPQMQFGNFKDQSMNQVPGAMNQPLPGTQPGMNQQPMNPAGAMNNQPPAGTNEMQPKDGMRPPPTGDMKSPMTGPNQPGMRPMGPGPNNMMMMPPRPQMFINQPGAILPPPPTDGTTSPPPPPPPDGATNPPPP